MTHGLNLTLPIKQDAATQAALQELKDKFPTIQSTIGAALAKFHRVHFARVCVVDNKYIQVITEYEGAHDEYIEFFRRELTPIFEKIFALADVPADVVQDPDKFRDYSVSRQIRSLGTAEDGAVDFAGKPSGWLFSAYNYKTVEDIQAALAKA
ncbi:MAG: hypothetical protein HYS06_13275 [Methylocystis sp.]|nr:hypothetical protein [Methylocystis sp.]